MQENEQELWYFKKDRRFPRLLIGDGGMHLPFPFELSPAFIQFGSDGGKIFLLEQ